MAEGDALFYTEYTEEVNKGSIDWLNDTIKITLHKVAYTPDQDNDTVYADATDEYATGTGYTNGGGTLAGASLTKTPASNKTVIDFNAYTWSSLGPLAGEATPSWAVVRNTTVDTLILYIELGTTATDGNDYTITPHASGVADMTLV